MFFHNYAFKKKIFHRSMSKLLYIDTNIWISLFKEEKDYLRPISDFSFEPFRRALNCEFDIVISSWLLKELVLTRYSKDSDRIIQEFRSKHKIVFVKTSQEDYALAKKEKHWQDRLHEILAQKGNADFIVTRNLKDFKGDLVQTKLPENL